jgi:NAD(P)-dependent dehydrogenase (short-subunit alcohol dehydrogenase family)
MVMKSVGPVLVTGASTGIGRAITEMLAADGHMVYATARRKADLEQLAEIQRVDPIKLDVTNPAEVSRAAAIVMKRGKGLYGLVNNAGIGMSWPLPELDVEDLEHILGVNLYGVHRMTQAMLPFLLKSRGRIVNIGSISGLSCGTLLGPYCISKHALGVYTEVLAKFLKTYKMGVSIIDVGAPFRSEVVKTEAEWVRRRASKHAPIFMEKEISELLRSLDKEIESAKREPTPEVVPHAVADALFSKHPRLRYCPCITKDYLRWTLKGPITRAVQANLSSGKPAITRDEMLALVDRIWDKEGGKPKRGWYGQC